MATAPDFWGQLNTGLGRNSNALIRLGTGLLSENTIGGGIMAAGNGFTEGRKADDAYATAQKAEAERQRGLNSTIEFMRQKGYGDLVSAVEGGGLDMGTAWGEALKRSAPKDPAAPIKVGAGETLLDPNTYEPVYQGAPDPKESFNNESDLWKQYASADPVKTYEAVKGGYERVRSSAELGAAQPQASGAADISMIYAYMKMLDPGSVVREGEFATAENAGGIGATVTNMYNKLLNGGRLTPQLRSEFLKSADELYGDVEANLGEVNNQFTQRANAYGVDPTRVIRQPEAFQPLGISEWQDAGGGFKVRAK